MAIEFVETASSGDDSSGQHGAADDAMALTVSMAALDDWATGDQEQLLGGAGDFDDHAAAMWHMDSIDVASCFAGETTHRSASSSTTTTSNNSSLSNPTSATSTLGPMTAALHGSDPLFSQTLTNWWEQGIDNMDTKPPAYPSMPPLPAKHVAQSSQYNPDKEVTDALLAVFAPHALGSDDSQTDSGTESGSIKLEQLKLTRSDSSVSNASSSYVSSDAASTTALPPRVPTQAAAVKKGKGKARSGSGQAAAAKLEIADDELGLTPLEIRRKRNRESMQRARRRQRDDVEEMKETLQELELHYQKLSEAAQERRSHSGAGVATAPTRESQRLEADYYAAADLSHSLKEEKFLLELMLTDKQKTFRRMQQVMVDRVQELELPCPTTTTPESLFADFEFAPITEAQANELVRQCYQMILQFQDTAAPLTPPRGMPADAKSSKPKTERVVGTLSTSKLPPAATFGWKVTCHVTPEQNFFVSFAKYFKGVSAEEAMLATWMRARNPHVNRNPNRRLYQYKVLQVINDSTYVAGMDIHHPVKKDKHMRNMFCRFRLQTNEGVYVIGRASMNPKSPELRRMAEEHATFEYVDNYSWIEFSSVVDKDTGESGVWVKFNARTEYNTQEDSHLRLVNSLYVTLKWESAVIPNAKTSFFLPS